MTKAKASQTAGTFLSNQTWMNHLMLKNARNPELLLANSFG